MIFSEKTLRSILLTEIPRSVFCSLRNMRIPAQRANKIENPARRYAALLIPLFTAAAACIIRLRWIVQLNFFTNRRGCRKMKMQQRFAQNNLREKTAPLEAFCF